MYWEWDVTMAPPLMPADGHKPKLFFVNHLKFPEKHFLLNTQCHTCISRTPHIILPYFGVRKVWLIHEKIRYLIFQEIPVTQINLINEQVIACSTWLALLMDGLVILELDFQPEQLAYFYSRFYSNYTTNTNTNSARSFRQCTEVRSFYWASSESCGLV